MRLVFVGECMVELAPDGDRLRRGFAGDTFNMAWYARRLCPGDWAVDYVTAIGTDAISDEMAAFIAASGIGTAHVQRREDRTVGLYLISLSDGERSFSYWRGQSAARLLAADRTALDRAFAGADIVCLSGITVAVLEDPGRDTLAAALADYRAGGGSVVFDPNIRPRLWHDAATMRAVLTRFAGLSDVVLASFEDEASHFGDADPAATVARYRATGAPCVVVKDGANPIHATEVGRDTTVSPDPVRTVVDSTAAGDSFNAAYLVGLLSGADMSARLTAGAALSRRVIQQRGALSDAAVDGM
ncbi:sugar kinase [Pseudooceanicola sp. LIPI14-2-Ac024]|uniref:sugar kinase n=1 Tax=Pseudooceanicola sp. LIPI14-2-Ac024 TaxID=3344875 RepID=UPI0035D024F4